MTEGTMVKTLKIQVSNKKNDPRSDTFVYLELPRPFPQEQVGQGELDYILGNLEEISQLPNELIIKLGLDQGVPWFVQSAKPVVPRKKKYRFDEFNYFDGCYIAEQYLERAEVKYNVRVARENNYEIMEQFLSYHRHFHEMNKAKKFSAREISEIQKKLLRSAYKDTIKYR